MIPGMRVKIEGDSLPARSIRTYLEKHGAAVVTEGKAQITIVIESFPAVTDNSIELDTIPCNLQASLVKHLSKLVPCPVVLSLEKTGVVKNDDRVVIRIPELSQIESPAEIAIYRGVAEFLGRAPQERREPNPAKAAFETNPVKGLLGFASVVIFVTVVVMGLFFLFGGHALGAEDPAPKAVSIEDREAVKDLQIKASDAVIRQFDAERRIAEARLDLEHAERDRDTFNAQIRVKTEELVKKYAPDGKWQITPTFTWELKKGTP